MLIRMLWLQCLKTAATFVILSTSCWQLLMKMKKSENLIVIKILMARNKHASDQICCFDKSNVEINFMSESYIDMVYWKMVEFDSPPLLQDITSVLPVMRK